MSHVAPNLVAQIGNQYGIPARIFLNMIRQESGFRTDAVSSAGARGPGQLMPATARGLGVNIDDPTQNLQGAARYLKTQFDRFHRWDLALAAYNAGPNAVAKYGGVPPYSQTQNYVRNILGSKPVAVEPSHTSAMPSVAQQQAPAQGTHPHADFAMGLIAAMQNHSPEAMIGAIMQLRQSLNKPQPVSQPVGADPGGPPAQGPQSEIQKMLAAQRLARQMGLHMGENYDLPGGVHPVHVKDSYHYRKFQGTNIGEATDVSGSPSQMAAYYRALSRTNPTELFYDPLGGMKFGKQIGAIGGHRDHVHIAY